MREPCVENSFRLSIDSDPKLPTGTAADFAEDEEEEEEEDDADVDDVAICVPTLRRPPTVDAITCIDRSGNSSNGCGGDNISHVSPHGDAPV